MDPRWWTSQLPLDLEPQYIVVLQSLSWVQLFVTPGTAARQALLSSTISWSLPKFISVESVMPSNHLNIYMFTVMHQHFLSGKESSWTQYRRPKTLRCDPWSERSPGEGNGNSLQYFLPGKFHGQRSLAVYIHGVAKGQTWLSTHTKSSLYILYTNILLDMWFANIFSQAVAYLCIFLVVSFEAQ